ncbi:MAG: SRPBCC domain-containing protein, partial [Candidatus Promineifilaceae bacterium]
MDSEKDRELVITRVFAAPRSLIFKVWTDPDHVAHWWGPRGFTLTTEVMDVRPGGVWRYVMHGP